MSSRVRRFVDASRRALASSGATPRTFAILLALAGALALAARIYEPLVAGAIAIPVIVLGSALFVLVRASRLSSSRASRLARALTPPLVVFAVTVAVAWPAWSGQRRMFLDQDHGMQLVQARYFLGQLAKGRVFQWSNLWNGGDAISDTYGWGGNLVVGAFRVLSFHALSFERAYQCTICFLFSACALVTYAGARRFARRSIALVVALLPVSQWFWRWPLFFGSWGAQLATELALLGVLFLVDVARRGKTSSIVLAALSLGYACVCHSFGLLVVAFIGVPVMLAAALGPLGVRRRSLLALFATACGLGLAAFWVVPMTRALGEVAMHWTLKGYERDAGMQKLVGAPTTTNLFFGGAALLIALFHRDRFARAIAFGTLLAVFVQSSNVVGELHLADTTFGASMQWFRLEGITVAAAPIAMAAVIERAIARARPSQAFLAWRPLAARIGVASALAVFVAPQVAYALQQERVGLLTQGVGHVLVENDAFEALITRVADDRANAGDAWPYRILFLADTDLHYAMQVADRTGVPVMTRVLLACLMNKNRLYDANVESTRAWGVRDVIVDRASILGAPFVKVDTLGPFTLYRDPGFTGMARAPEGVRATITSFDDAEVRVAIEGAGPDGADVQLGLAAYPRWRATQDGHALAIDGAASMKDGPLDQVMVHAHDGELVLRSNGALPGQWRGLALSFLALVALVGFAIARKNERIRARFGDVLARARLSSLAERARVAFAWRRLPIVVVAFGLVLFVAGVAWPSRRSARPMLRTFGPDAAAVRRFDLATNEPTRCWENPFERAWECAGVEPSDPGLRVALDGAVDPPARPSLWSGGAAFTAIRVDEKRGGALVTVRLAHVARGAFVHAHVERVGPPPSSFEAGWASTPHAHLVASSGWSTAVLPPPAEDTDALIVTLRFEAPGSLSFAIVVDDDPETPKLPLQQ